MSSSPITALYDDQSAVIMSSSPITALHDDQSAVVMSNSPSTVLIDSECSPSQPVDVVGMSTGAVVCRDDHGGESCDACDERQRCALVDSPPVSVLTGNVSFTLSLS